MNEENEFGSESLTPAALKQISDLARQQIRIEREIELIEASLKAEKEKLRNISETLLPNAMLEAGGLTAFTLDTGEGIEIKKELYCSVPKEGFPAAEEWLRLKGHEGIIKHQVVMSFGKGEDARAQKAATLLLESGFEFTDSKTIHPQTLKAFLREQMGEGVDVPLQTFGAYEATKSKIIFPKKK